MIHKKQRPNFYGVEVTTSNSYFLIRSAQTKVTSFIFVNNWVIRESDSFLLVEPCSRVNSLSQIQDKPWFFMTVFGDS